MSSYIDVGAGTSTGWQRPSEWLPIPAVGANEEVFYGLYAVWNTTVNPCALLCNGTGAGYTVDWGDGTTTNHAFNSKAQKNYVYADLSADTEFRGYRQALVKVTPQSGATITLIDFIQNHSSYSYAYHTGWLYMYSNFTTINSHKIGAQGVGDIQHRNCEEVYVKSISTQTSLQGLFMYMPNLKKVNNFNTSNVTNINYMFYNAFEIIEIPLYDFGNVTTATNAFESTKKLNSFLPTNFQKLITTTSMFLNSNIQDLSGVILRDITNFSGFLQNTFNLTKFPNISTLNISGVISYSLYGLNIAEYPAVNLANVTNMTDWLYGIGTRSLRKINAYGAKVTHTIANQLLDKEAIIHYANNIGTANAGATITITGNPGSAAFMADAAAVALFTSKGWTIIN